MSFENVDKDWIIELWVRPNQMSPIDPPSFVNDEYYSRILFSIYGMTSAESLTKHLIDEYINEHIQLEKECSKLDDLTLIWSDDVTLTLCFLASLAYSGKYSQQHLLHIYFQWWMNAYMCPTGHCFTPHVHIKKSIDLFGETQAAEALGIEVDLEKKTAHLFPTASSLIRLSPIAYFYSKHSQTKRIEIIEDYVQRMFGKKTSTQVFIQYVELIVNAIHGLSKQDLIKSINLTPNSNDFLNKIFFDLIDLLTNDQNNIQFGINLALEKQQSTLKESKYLNPYDSDRNILLTLYLQISAPIYNKLPEQFLNNIYAKQTLDGLVKWIIYQANIDLHSI